MDEIRWRLHRIANDIEANEPESANDLREIADDIKATATRQGSNESV